MFSQKISIDLIESSCVKVTFPTCSTYFSLHSLDYIKLAMKPMLPHDLLFARIAATKFTNHCSSVKAYTVIIIRLASSLNLQITWIFLPSLVKPSMRYLVPRISSDNFLWIRLKLEVELSRHRCHIQWILKLTNTTPALMLCLVGYVFCGSRSL